MDNDSYTGPVNASDIKSSHILYDTIQTPWNSSDPVMNTSTLNISAQSLDSECLLFGFIFSGIIGLIVCIVGIAGNVLTLVVIPRISEGSITFRLLFVLAVVDIIQLASYMLVASVAVLLEFYKPETLVDVQFLMWLIFPMHSMSITASCWITTLVTTYRYIIAKLLLRQTKVFTMNSIHIQVIVILVLSVVLDIPKYFERVPVQNAEAGTILLKVTKLWHDQTYQLAYRSIIMLVVRRLLPIVITIIMVYKRVRLFNYWRQERRRKFNKSRLPDNQELISKVMVVLAVLFILLQIPATMYPIFRLVMDIPRYRCGHFYLYFYTLADLLSLLNSALLFFIFYPAIPQYRQVLSRMFCAEKPDVTPTRIHLNSQNGSSHLSCPDDISRRFSGYVVNCDVSAAEENRTSLLADTNS